MLLLLSCWIIAGLRAEDSPTRHYRVKNSSFCWTFDKFPPCNDSMWLLNSKVIAVDKRVTAKYADRMDYDTRNCSLCIKKLSETDNGKHELIVIYSKDKTLSKTIILFVEDAVPTPVLRILPIPANLSGESCNITVNCSVQDEWAWSVCNEDGCTPSQVSLNKVNITISAENRTVTCSGNNHVSTNNVTASTEAMCFNDSKLEQEEKSQPPSLIVTVVVFSLCLFICAICVAKLLCSKKSNHQQTTQLAQSQPAEAQPRPAPRASVSSSDEVSYENVNAPQTTQTSGQIELGSKQSREVDTVYSFLQVPNKAAAERM